MAERADRALNDLLALVRDVTISMRDRINSAVSASRVSPLSMSGESEPEAIAFLRWIIDFKGQKGERFSPSFRRESAAALSFWERRSKKAELQYEVADVDDRSREWRRLINGLLYQHLWAHNRWPQDKNALFGLDEPFEIPPYDPELGLAALFFGANRQQRQRRRTIDQPVKAAIVSEEQRHEILRSLARIMHRRLTATP